jgi:hypothetical protein
LYRLETGAHEQMHQHLSTELCCTYAVQTRLFTDACVTASLVGLI